LAAICAAAAVGGAGAQAPIKIGFMAELSGPQAPLGQDQYDAFMMVVEQNGGKLGGVPVQVIREDSQLKPEVATQLVDKLIEKDKVPIITGITFSNVMMAVHKKITDQEVFLIGSNAGPAPIAGAQCSPYTFITSWQNDNQAEVVGEYANQKGYKKVIGMAPNYQAGKDFIAASSAITRARSSTRSTRRSTSPTSPRSLRKSRQEPDAVYVFYPGGLGVNFVRQYKQAGLMGKVPLLSTSTTTARRCRRRRTTRWASSRHVLGPGLQQSREPQVRRRLREEVQPHPSQYAAQSYDAALLLDSAIAKVKGNVADKKAFKRRCGGGLQERARQLQVQQQRLPHQDQYIFEVAKDAKGRVSLKTIGAPLKDHKDAYYTQCKLT
jgi:branched-chain amino acid transport system substrate-binding protein